MSDLPALPSPPTENPDGAGTAPFDAAGVVSRPEAAGTPPENVALAAGTPPENVALAAGTPPGSVAQAAGAAQAQAGPSDDVVGGEATLAATSWGGASEDEAAADEPA